MDKGLLSAPEVSVIMPAYNHAAFVTEALDSILAEGYPNKKLYIIDDGSTDDTAARIEQWIEKSGGHLEVFFKSRPNRGVSATLNELLDLVSTKYVAGASSDDTLLPGGIAARVEYLLQNKNKKAVFGDAKVIDEQGREVYASCINQLHKADSSRYSSDYSLRSEILYRFAVAGPVLMFDKSIFGDIGLYNESFAVEDWDLYMRMSANGLLGFIDMPA